MINFLSNIKLANKLLNNTLKKVANLFEDALKMGHDYTRN